MVAKAPSNLPLQSPGPPRSRNFLALFYDVTLPIKDKIEILAREVYGADGVDYSPEVAKVDLYTALGYDKLPICMAKTHLSLSHDPNLKGVPRGYTFHPRHPRQCGSRIPVPLAGEMSTMPGLSQLSQLHQHRHQEWQDRWALLDCLASAGPQRP